jgi:hypothetical protein
VNLNIIPHKTTEYIDRYIFKKGEFERRYARTSYQTITTPDKQIIIIIMKKMKKVLSNPALCQELDKSSWLWTPPGASRKKYESHDFAGYGSYDVKTTPSLSDIQSIDNSFHEKEKGEKRLGELEATAISGNGTCVISLYCITVSFFFGIESQASRHVVLVSHITIPLVVTPILILCLCRYSEFDFLCFGMYLYCY